MVSSYIRLQALFVFSLLILYIFIIFIWFIAEDDTHRQIAERDFAKVIQSRNQLKDSLLSDSKLSVTEDKKIRSLRFICNAWLRKLNSELRLSNKDLKKRIALLKPPVGSSSGVYIAQNKRLFISIGNTFEEYLESNWARNFYSALRYGKRFFQEFITKLYTREITVEEFESTSDDYQILQIKGRSYYRYYTTIKNFNVLLLVDLSSINGPMILNYFIDAFIADDKRFKRDSMDILDWSGQGRIRSKPTSFGLRFTPERVGLGDFIINKWVSHVAFLIFLIVLIGKGGYQILSLRLELRVMSLMVVCFIFITLIHRNQSLKISEMDHFDVLNKLKSEAYTTARDVEDVYKTRLDEFLEKLRIGLDPLENSKIRYLQIGVDTSGKAQIVDNIDYPILINIASQVMRRWHLIRRGFDPATISLKDEIDNRLEINLPKIGPLALGALSKASRLIENINFSDTNYELYEFNFTGENYIMITPGIQQDKDFSAKLICLVRNDLITHFLQSEDWGQRRFSIINLTNTKSLFQNFEQTWTDVRLDRFLSNRNLPDSLREDRNIDWISLKWDELLLLHKTSIDKGSIRFSKAIKILGGILILIYVLITFQRVFMSWIDRLVKMLNFYRLKGRMQLPKIPFFKHEGYRLSLQLIKLVDLIEAQPFKEIKLCSFLDDFVTMKRSEYVDLTFLELYYGSIGELELRDLCDVINRQLERFDGFQMDGGVNCLRLVFQTDGNPTLVQNSIEAGLGIRDWLKSHSDIQFSILIRSGQFRMSLSKPSPEGSPIISIQRINVVNRHNPFLEGMLVIDNASQKFIDGLYDFEKIDNHFYQVVVR